MHRWIRRGRSIAVWVVVASFAGALLLFNTQARAQATYIIDRNSDTLIPRTTQATPINWSGSAVFDYAFYRKVWSYTLAALPGSVHSYSREDAIAHLAYTVGVATDIGASAEARTTDFLITGPAGPTTVNASMAFTVSVAISDTGGWPAHGANNGGVSLNLSATGFTGGPVVQGTYSFGNSGNVVSATGPFAGQAGSSFVLPIVLTANYPVNRLFQVRLYASSSTSFYGDADRSPALVQADIRVQFADPSHVMTLPSGYSVSSPAWGIGNNIQNPCRPAITQQPASTSICNPGAAGFTFAADGGTGGAPAIQWRVESPAGSGTYADLPLAAGGTFTEPATGMSFGVVGAGSGTLTVSNIALGSHAGTITLVGVASNACGSVTSSPATLTVNTCGCNAADIVAIGGSRPPDGLVTGDDFNAFIAAFAAGDPLADVVSIGGLPPPDGLVTGDDFNAFIAAFAAGCP